jgi:hypothetical protein
MTTMSACHEFLDLADHDLEIARMMRAITDLAELPLLGQRLGFAFDGESIMAAVMERNAHEGAAEEKVQPSSPEHSAMSSALHYEFQVGEIAELAPIIDELPRLRVRPATADLDRFRSAFRADDYQWADQSPASPGFQERYDEIMAPHWTGSEDTPVRRDFHLINLDQTPSLPEYEAYFDAKVRTLEHLETVFGPDIRFSGSMWYPPYAYRLWHTNQTQPGWRMYLIDFDEEIPAGDTRTFMRYMNPYTKELVTLADRPKLIRFFQIREDPVLWHCIVNRAERDRWSFGFAVPDDWMQRLSEATPTSEKAMTIQ